MRFRCDECGRETVASFQPFCTCEKGSPMTEVPVPLEEEKLPKVIQVLQKEIGFLTVLLDDGNMWIYREHLSEMDRLEYKWELFEGPPCTLPKSRIDSSDPE